MMYSYKMKLYKVECIIIYYLWPLILRIKEGGLRGWGGGREGKRSFAYEFLQRRRRRPRKKGPSINWSTKKNPNSLKLGKKMADGTRKSFQVPFFFTEKSWKMAIKRGSQKVNRSSFAYTLMSSRAISRRELHLTAIKLGKNRHTILSR